MSLEQILDYVENFDDKGIQIVFLMTPTRCGANLLHSLLDHHSQILQVPVTLGFLVFQSWFLNAETTDGVVDNFCGRVRQTREYLGPHGDESVEIPVADISKIMKQILPRLSRLDNQSVALAYHFSYASLRQIPLEQVKLILVHVHEVPGWKRRVSVSEPPDPNDPAYWPKIYTRSLGDYSRDGDPYLESLLASFPNARFLVTIRSPMATWYIRHCKVTVQTRPDSKGALRADLPSVFWLYKISLNYYWIYAMKRHQPERFYLVKFEDMHSDVARTMAKLAADFGLDYEESMTRTTFGGKMWKAIEFNSYGHPPMADTCPERLERDHAWKTEMDPQLMRQCYTLCRPLYDWFDYDPVFSQAPIPMEVDWACLDAMMPIEQVNYERFPEAVKNHYLAQLKTQAQAMFPAPNQDFESFYAQWEAKRASADRHFQEAMAEWETYPTLRMRTLQYLKQAQADWAGTSVRDLAP